MKLRPIYFKCNFLLVQNYLLSTDLFRTSCLLSEQERSNLVTVVSLPTKTQRSKLLVFKVEVTLDNPPPMHPSVLECLTHPFVEYILCIYKSYKNRRKGKRTNRKMKNKWYTKQNHPFPPISPLNRCDVYLWLDRASWELQCLLNTQQIFEAGIWTVKRSITTLVVLTTRK